MGRRKIYKDHNNAIKAQYRKRIIKQQFPLMVELVERVRQSDTPSEDLALSLLEDYKITVSLSRSAPIELAQTDCITKRKGGKSTS